jgi:glucan biosynthesis protein C
MYAVVFWAARFSNGGPVPGAAGWPPMLPRFPLTHLWFLYVLLEFYAATLVLRTGMAWLDRSGRIRAGVDGLIGLAMRSPLAPATLAVPIGIALHFDPAWLGFQGVPTPDQSLVTNLQAVVGYGTAFGFGWLLHRQIDLIRILERRWLFNIVLAIGLIAASFVLAKVPQPRPDAIRLADVTS